MKVGHRRVFALPPISRRDFISNSQFRSLVKHTCVCFASCAHRRASYRSTCATPQTATTMILSANPPKLRPNCDPHRAAGSTIWSRSCRQTNASIWTQLWYAALRYRCPGFFRERVGVRARSDLRLSTTDLNMALRCVHSQRKERTSLVSLWSVLPHVVGAYLFVEAVQRAHWQLQLEDDCCGARRSARTS
jgi:hypothetical protein